MSAWLALLLTVIYLGAAFVLRSVVQRRRTGSTGFRGVSGRPWTAEWLGGVLFAIALLLGLAAPALQLAGGLHPVGAIDTPAVHLLGAVLAMAGITATLVAQSSMGASWRVGVDADETTALVTSGAFAVVRNPVFAAMLPTGLGLTLLAANPVSIVAFMLLVVAIELQTRVVEEPYLLSTHGTRYATYAGRVGRFVPGVGRLS